MTELQTKILTIYKNNPLQTLERISVEANCSIRYCSMVINDFNEFSEKDEEEMFLVPSLSLPNIFYLFYFLGEKTVRTHNYKIQNYEDFSQSELKFLEKNYNFTTR